MTEPSENQQNDELGWYMEGSPGEIADILMQFAQQLRNGDVNVWKGQRELHLMPEGRLQFQVHAIADDDGREGLHMKLHWNVTTGAADLHGAASDYMGTPLGGQEGTMENQ